jgi:hypothetical protein
MDQFEEVVKFIAENTGKTLILYNNKAKIEELAATLRDLDLVVEMVDADRIKDTSTVAYQLSIDDNFKMDQIDVLIGTTSLVEGISIQDDITHANAIVMGDSDIPPEHIKQLCGRFRKASTVNCLHLGVNSLDKRIEDPDKWLAEQRSNAQFINGLAQNLTSCYHQYDYNEHADWIKSTGFDIAKYGIEYDPINRSYTKSDISLLFDSSRCKTSQFYADFHHAGNVMTEMGFTVQLACRTESIDELQDTIRENCQRVRIGRKLQRAASAEKFILILKRFFKKTGHIDFDVLYDLLRTDGQMVLDEFQQRIFNMIRELDLEKLSTDDVLVAIDQMIKGKLNDRTIILNGSAKASQFGIMHDLRENYPSGTKLNIQEQKGIVQDVLERLVAVTQDANQCSPEVALEFVLRQNTWKNVSSKIQWVNAKIVLCDIERPSALLKKFMPSFQSKSARNLDGTVNRVIEIL